MNACAIDCQIEKLQKIPKLHGTLLFKESQTGLLISQMPANPTNEPNPRQTHSFKECPVPPLPCKGQTSNLVRDTKISKINL